MKAVKAIYQNGKIKLSEKPEEAGPTEVLVVFPEQVEDPWQKILDDPRPRPALEEYVKQCREEIAQGKTRPLDLDQL